MRNKLKNYETSIKEKEILITRVCEESEEKVHKLTQLQNTINDLKHTQNAELNKQRYELERLEGNII
jgi:SMC interacting uncharacterized protein involved in chromosome segregation